MNAGDLGELRALLVAEYGDGLGKVLGMSSFLVDGVATRGGALAEGSTVDVLPPFAGG